MHSIDPAPGKIKTITNEVPLDAPILMLNLLRFNELANYPEDSDNSACSGLEAYQIYSNSAFPKIKAVGGSMFWQSQVLTSVIAPDDEEWDKAFLISWPSFQSFLDVVMSPDYQKITVHRTAALKDSRLIMLENK
jgi:uncharacterized protein (DUF1330 family)